MTDFIRAYDTRTGEKLTNLVPKHFLKLFPYLSATPTEKVTQRHVKEPAKPAETKETKNG